MTTVVESNAAVIELPNPGLAFHREQIAALPLPVPRAGWDSYSYSKGKDNHDLTCTHHGGK